VSQQLVFQRDPFFPAVPRTAGGSKPILMGIVWDQEKPTAIINGEIVEKGKKFSKYTVLDIQRDRVTISDGQVTEDLILKLEVKP
jgi:hypothetical protein